jgi:hypothetical protein
MDKSLTPIAACMGKGILAIVIGFIGGIFRFPHQIIMVIISVPIIGWSYYLLDQRKKILRQICEKKTSASLSNQQSKNENFNEKNDLKFSDSNNEHPFLTYIKQYIKNQKQLLENLEKFYEYLKLKKIGFKIY